IIAPQPIDVEKVLYIAILGLAVNGYGLYALKSELKDINIRGSFLHLLIDTLGSLGVIISSLVVAYTHFYQIDALASVAIGILAAYPTYFLIKDSLHILMEGAPPDIDLDDIKDFISNDFNGKAEHIHIWALTPDKTIMVVRIKTSGKAEVGSLKSALKSRFGFCDVFLETDEGMKMPDEFVGSKIQELIKQKDWRRLKEILSNWPAPDIADLFENIRVEEAVILFRLLHKQQAASVFSEVESNKQMALLQEMSNEHVQDIISELSPDDRTELFEELPGEITQRLLNLLSSDIRRESLELLGYPKESVGRLMTPEYVAIRPHWTIEQALEHIHRYGRDAETIHITYVVDEKWHLLDDIPLRKLILADPEQKVESLMDKRFVSILAHEDQEKAIKLTKRYNLFALPVIDSENVLLGIVTVDDILDVLEEEVTEDIHKGASVVPLDMSYSAASVWTLYSKRIIWLSLLLVAGFLSSSVIAAFEHTLTAIVALAFFIPVLIGSGGNTGTQSATLVIRAIATGDLSLRKWFSVVKKELLVGLLLGVTLGGVLCLWSFFWKGGAAVGTIAGMSMVIIILWANLVGSLLPIILTKIKLDPAVVSSPLITTLLDATGLLVYFSIAKWWLKF
ncbi:MAG: magnesium transporter, partial [Desulfobacterales bacterium]|nr:magnesium transporter [Desulfobacterales bacterium]